MGASSLRSSAQTQLYYTKSTKKPLVFAESLVKAYNPPVVEQQAGNLGKPPERLSRPKPLVMLLYKDPKMLPILSSELAVHGVVVEGAAAFKGIATAVNLYKPNIFLVNPMGMGPEDSDLDYRDLKRKYGLPIIIFSEKGDTNTIVEALSGDNGADDYVVIPFSPEELGARIRNQLRSRKRYPHPAETEQIRAIGNLRVDLKSLDLSKNEQKIKLSPREWEVLSVLLANFGSVVLPEELLIKAFGTEYSGRTSYVRDYIFRLRRKIEDDPKNPKYILNVREIGYMLRAPKEK